MKELRDLRDAFAKKAIDLAYENKAKSQAFATAAQMVDRLIPEDQPAPKKAKVVEVEPEDVFEDTVG